MLPMTFDLDVLRTFVLGFELGTFTKAADRLGRSTSAVSAQLKKLEDQVGVAIVQKSGRGMVLTAEGEILFGYAKRLLALNDEAATAVRGSDLQGSIRLGLQEDFAAHILTEVLGRFARTHPRVHIEARVARNAELLDLVGKGRLDLALAWEAGLRLPFSRRVAELPLCWIGRSDEGAAAVIGPSEGPLPLVSLDPPCLLRTAAITALDQAGVAWRSTFTSPSLGGVWAAVGAGLGVTVRTPVGLPKNLRILSGLPPLPDIALMLHWAEAEPTPLARHLGEILRASLDEALRSLSLGQAA